MFGQPKNNSAPWKLPGAIGWEGFVDDLEKESTESKSEQIHQQEEQQQGFKESFVSLFKGSEGTLFTFSQTNESEYTLADTASVAPQVQTESNVTVTQSGSFDYSKWLGVGADTVSAAAKATFSEVKTVAGAVSEVVKPVLTIPKEAPKKDPQKEAAQKAAAQMRLQQIIQQTEAGIQQAREIRELNEDARLGAAGLSSEQLSKETGLQSGFRGRKDAYTRGFLGLKAVWNVKKQQQNQSLYQIAAGRGKGAVNLNAAAEGGTGGAKMNISSTGGGAG